MRVFCLLATYVLPWCTDFARLMLLKQNFAGQPCLTFGQRYREFNESGDWKVNDAFHKTYNLQDIET